MDDSARPAWEVTGQAETVEQGPSGTFVPGVRVTFRVASGAMGSVFIPQADYTVETARTRIDAAAATVAGVQALRG